MTWTLRRILIVIVVLSTLAVAGTLYWVTATYQRFAISNQNDVTASTIAYLVHQQMEDEHRRKVSHFIDEWSRLSTLVQGMRENDPEKARLAANRMMLTLEVAEGRVHLRNVVIYSKDLEVVASADKGTGESLTSLPGQIDRLRQRDRRDQRQIAAFPWRGPGGRPLHSTIAPIGGFQVAGFVEFVTDPIPDLAGVAQALPGRFSLVDVNGRTLLTTGDTGAAATPASPSKLDTLEVPISDATGRTWVNAMLTRDVSGFRAAVTALRNQALAIVAVMILGSVLIGWLLLRLAVFDRLTEFAAITSKLARGQTDVEIPSVGPDELAIMRTSLESLRNAVTDRERATAALRESEQRVKAIIDNSPNAIHLKDAQGRYTLVNASTAKDQGIATQEMIGKTAYDYFSKTIADQISEQEASVLATGEVSERELEFTSTVRGPRVGLMVKFPVFDVNGAITAVGTIISDITERKQSEKALLTAREKAEEQAKLQRIILDNVGQGILVFHKNGLPLLWNDLAVRFTGLRDALRHNEPLQQCNKYQFETFDFDPGIVDLVLDFDRRRKAGERDFVVTYQRRGINGSGWVQVSLRALADGMVVQTYQDITDLRQAIDAAQDAQRLAEDANRAKSDFLSNMSHELRTPLNAIIGFTEFVVDNHDEPISRGQAASLAQVLKAGRHLLLLINDVLDLSRIETGAISLSLEPVDPGLVIDECVSLTASFAAGRNVRIDNLLAEAALPSIEADRIRFKQVILNLLSNAIKYNKSPGRVFVERAPAKAGMLRIGVRDEGAGIPAEHIAKLFDPFDRLGAENSAIEGTGIGLTITRKLVEQMKGAIAVESAPGKGSTFWLEMPISERPALQLSDSDEREGGPVADICGLVLHIEDNPANLELVSKIMSRQPGVDFIDAPTGEIGIERARTEAPDVILLDINLPGQDGFQVLDALKGMPETRHVPVIALTAAATELDVRRGQTAGFFSYLTKPIAARELLIAIRRALHPTAPDGAAPLRPLGKVLAVDDMPINLTVTQAQLAKLGVSCEVTSDPVKALQMLEAGDYALALVDIGMPVLNGIELTQQLRQAEKKTGRRTPVVALTANYGSEAVIARYRKAGFDGQLTKPVSLKELAATLQQWFGAGWPATRGVPCASDAAAAPSEEAEAPPVDLAQFKEILGTHDNGLIREMFDLFIAHMPHELENLASAVAARDRTLSREAAHRFKSAARNSAARRLSELLHDMECESQAGVWDKLDRDLKRVREECARVTDFMQAAA